MDVGQPDPDECKASIWGEENCGCYLCRESAGEQQSEEV